MPRPKNYRNNPYYYSSPGVPRNPARPISQVTPPIPPTSALTVYRPTSLVPYSPPGALAKFRPPPIPRIPPGVGSVAAGSFKAATSGVALRTVGKLGLRAIPWVGVGFVALDALLIACAAGLLPGGVCPRPDNPSPSGIRASFDGGQCVCTVYRVNYSYKRSSFPNDTTSGFQTAYGAIQGLEVLYPAANSFSLSVICRGSSGGACGAPNQRVICTSGGLFTGEVLYEVKITSIVVNGGGADTCGNQAPKLAQNAVPDIYQSISNTVNNINNNLYIISLLVPSPSPKRDPIVLNPPSPLPTVYISFPSEESEDSFGDPDINLDYRFAANPSRNYGDFVNAFDNSPPSSQPRTRDSNPVILAQAIPLPIPPLITSPQLPPPIPIGLPADATEADLYQLRQSTEILEKLYRANAEIVDLQSTLDKQGRILENIQSLLDIEVQGSQIIKRCDDLEIVYSYKSKLLSAINTQLNHVQMIEQTIINEVCEVESAAVVAAPESWAVRIAVNPPQIALIFRVSDTRTYHKLTIPHPISVVPLASPPIAGYQKGNWKGEITCVDNSKFICHCATKTETTRLLSIAASLIDPVFLGDPVRFYYAERAGVVVKPGTMIATSAQFFPTGQQQLRPLWRVAFTQDGQ